MMTETYQVLAECAHRRIGQEWACTEAERAVLSLVNDLSFCLGQSLALVPCLADFAAVTGLHKSTISRAIRSALKKGYLMIVKRRDETLYAVCTDTAGTVATEEGQDREAAKERLVQLNETRLQGQADGNGQQRLPGILPSEEIAAPAAAFAAMLEASEPEKRPNELCSDDSPPAATRVNSPVYVAPEEVLGKLDRLTRAMDERRGDGVRVASAAVAPDPVKPDVVLFANHPQGQRPLVATEARRRSGGREPARWEAISRGLQGDALHALETIREECILAGEKEEQAFYQWGLTWRKRCTAFPLASVQAAGICKAMRQEGSRVRAPGAFIYRELQRLTASPAEM